MQCTIRDFIPEDMKIFEDLGTEFYQTNAVNHSIPKENFKKTFTMCIEKSPYIRGLLIESGGKPAGYALLTFTYSNETGGIVIWLDELFILPEYQGNGFARKFFDFVDTEYMHKATRYRLEVTKSNIKAAEIYKKYGFDNMKYLPMVKELT